MNKKFILLISIISILTLVVGCTVDENNNPPPEEPSNPSEEDENHVDEEPINWQEYTNNRFNFSIEYPETWAYNEAENGDGITFFVEDEDKDIRVYGTNYIEDISKPYENENKEDLKRTDINLDSGIKASIISGEIDEEYHYEMVYIEDKIEYHLIAQTSIDYYNDNKELIDKMVNSFNVKATETSELSKEEALELENEYIDRVFPKTGDDSQKLVEYDTKEELIDYISEIANPHMAKQIVDNYYNKKEDGLYIIAKDAPTKIYPEKPYELDKIDDEKYNLVQSAEDNLRGKYKFTVEIVRKEDKWIINNRIFEKR